MEGAVTMAKAVEDIFTVASSALTVVTGNTVLMTFFCAGIVVTAPSILITSFHLFIYRNMRYIQGRRDEVHEKLAPYIEKSK